MIDDEEHPEWKAVTQALNDQIVALASEYKFNLRLIELMQGLCDDCTRKARVRGLAYPDIIVTYFTGCGEVRLYRRDATQKMIWTYAYNLVQECPHIKPEDLYEGMARSFPHLKLDRQVAKGQIWKKG